MNKKSLAIQLSKLKPLDNYSLEIEQYPTDSEIVAEILWHAYLHKDVEDMVIADFGCGSGIFGIGALLLGAKFVYFVDISKEALKITLTNIRDTIGRTNYSLVNSEISLFNDKVDTVFQNPPFGVQHKHADKPFLETAMRVSSAVYSLHKIESREFINELSKEYNFAVRKIMFFYLPIKQIQPFHNKRIHYVEVGCFILRKNNNTV